MRQTADGSRKTTSNGSRISTVMPPKPQPYRKRIEVLQGTLDLLILQTLRWGRQHGYGISNAIRSGSNELFDVETGSLYPALHRLERKGWIRSEWNTTENNQRAKYYSLTEEGKTQLSVEKERWETYARAVARLLNRKPAEGAL